MAIGNKSLACIVLPIFVYVGLFFFVNPEPIKHSNHVYITNGEPEPPSLNHGTNTNSEPEPPSLIHGTNSEPELPSLIPGMQLTERNTNTWCVAKPTADDPRLDANIQFCCTQPGVDCSPIQPGGQCYNPDHKCLHASVVMNLYYQANSQQPNACDFMGTGLIVYQNPFDGRCG